MFMHLTEMSRTMVAIGYYGWVSVLVGGLVLALGNAISAWRDF
jgi:hypothetical protein